VPVAPATGDGLNFPGTEAAPTRLLAYSADCFLGRIVEQIQQRNPAHHFDVCYENSMAEALKAMALAGHGAAWLPMSSIVQELGSGALVRVAGPAWELPLEVRLYRASARLRPAAASLWTHAVAIAASPDPPQRMASPGFGV